VNPWKARGVPLHGQGDPPLYGFLRFFCCLTLVPFYRYRVRGAEHMPASGGVILAVTHKSWADPVLTALAFRRPLRFMAKAEIFEKPLFARFVTALGAFPIRRGSADIEALRTTLAIVADGGVLLMFPEGHRFHDDEIHEYHAGIGMMAVRSGVPVLPVALQGTKRLTRNHVPLRPRIQVIVGPPVDLSGLQGRKSEIYEGATARIRADVAKAWKSL
jgi:1-acyl-sn-glycerol-3-phosphate acyltransferase